MNDWITREQAACPRGVSLATNIIAARAEGSELWDEAGRRYIDFVGGIGVLNTGHRHPRVQEAIVAQAGELVHSCFQVLPYPSYIRLAERLNELSPGDFAKKTLLMSTGAEAVENAIKIARAATGRPAIVAFNGAFHGRTLMALALTGKTVPYKSGIGPVPGDVHRVPFPADSLGITTQDALDALARVFKSDVEPSRVAAIIVEPVQGEGGFYPAPQEFMAALRRICDEHGILLIADEIQSGFGRTGKMFAMEHYGIAADLMTTAKSLAAGMPLSAVVGRADVMDALPPGGLGSTYAGNPLAVAAAHAVLDIFANEPLLERGNALGNRLVQRLEAAKARIPTLHEVRAQGAMVAAEFRTAQGAPSAEAAQAVRQAAQNAGLILLTCGQYGNVIRFLFPLTTSDAIFDEALDILDGALAAAEGAAR